MQRYQQLLGIIQQEKPATIIEVGTWNGDRAIEMASQLIADDMSVHYIGFDLWEMGSDEIDAEELNVKERVPVALVREKLNNFATANPLFSFKLFQGKTVSTLKEFDVSDLKGPVMAFIDGGHSCYTIANDLNALLGCDIVIMDDWYAPDEAGLMPDIEKFGCNNVLAQVGELGEHYFVMPVPDRVKDGGLVHMVSVGQKFDIKVRQKMEVKTKNSVSDEAIQRNILYSLQTGAPELQRCYPHDGKVTIVSGGESYKEHLDTIRQDQADGRYLVCVKTPHDNLIANGIIPDACILLDPRAHVVDFIERPHPEIQYLVASQIYWETMKHLIKHNALIKIYHAAVNAGENDILDGGKFMVMGGSTSATRGISLLHMLGFRDYRLYGYDSSFLEKPDDEMFERFKDKVSKRPLKVTVLGEEFWTTPELVSQSRDFEYLTNPASPNDSRLEVIGSELAETLIHHLSVERGRKMEEWDWAPRAGGNAEAA